MKEMFDRCYYPCLGRIEGHAYATIICAGSDGENAQRQLDRIATGWRLRRVADPMIVNVGAQTPEAILAPQTIPADRLAARVPERRDTPYRHAVESGHAQLLPFRGPPPGRGAFQDIVSPQLHSRRGLVPSAGN